MVHKSEWTPLIYYTWIPAPHTLLPVTSEPPHPHSTLPRPTTLQQTTHVTRNDITTSVTSETEVVLSYIVTSF